jgi:hypothetical protein
MINSILSGRWFYRVLFAIFLVVSIMVLMRPLMYSPDSPGYLDMHIIRSAGYPLFLWLIKMVSGDYFELVCKFIQLLIGLIAIRFFVLTIYKNSSLKPLWSLLLTLVLLIPYVYNENIANQVLSEAIAYPLYLVVTAFFIKSWLLKDKQLLLKATPFLFILLLTRSQFMYFIPLGLFIFWQLGRKTDGFKSKLGIFILLVVLPLLSSLTDRLYHQVANGHFVATPWTAPHFFSMAVVVSDAEDVALFATEKEKAYFSGVFNDLAAKGLQKHHLLAETGMNLADTYRENYSEILVRTVVQKGVLHLKNVAGDLTPEDHILIENTSRSMVLPLVLDNFGSWFKLYVSNFMAGFGSAKYGLLYLLIFGLALIQLRRSTRTELVLIAFSSFLAIANVALVALGPHTIKRLLFYNDWVLFLIVFLLLSKLFGSTEESPID